MSKKKNSLWFLTFLFLLPQHFTQAATTYKHVLKRAPESLDPGEEAIPLPYAALKDNELELIFTPPKSNPQNGRPANPAEEGHARWIQAIESANSSILLTMYHLTDPSVVQALKNASGSIQKNHPGTDPNSLETGVHILLDQAFFLDPKNAAMIKELEGSGAQVRASSPMFSITHEKAMVVDNAIAFITAMNLTTNETSTRDFGVVLSAKGGNPDTLKVIQEIGMVFGSDWENYQLPASATPLPAAAELEASSLIWSPENSENKLVDLINSALPHSLLLCSTESFTDNKIGQAFLDAEKRGVQVKFLAPQCDEARPVNMNIAPMEKLNQQAKNEIAFVEPGAGSASIPYIHSKMCLVNFNPTNKSGGTAFVGSVNFSKNSTQKARELGIVFQNDAANLSLYQLFLDDLKSAVNPSQPSDCGH